MGHRTPHGTGHRIAVDELLRAHGTTYASEARITLRDKPSPLFQLLVLAQLSSVRIGSHLAAAAAREVFRAGWRTPDRLRASTWQERVDALGRAHYKRYDESTARYLDQLAEQVTAELRGDLRRLRPEPGGIAGLERALQRFPRIGSTGAGIFCREVQAVWPTVRPYFDRRALDAAAELGYPSEPDELAALVPEGRVADLSAALVRWSLD